MNCTLENSQGCGTGCMIRPQQIIVHFLCGHIGGVSHVLMADMFSATSLQILDYDLDIVAMYNTRETSSCKL